MPTVFGMLISKTRFRVVPAGIVKALYQVTVPVDPEGFESAEPLNWLEPETYETVPGLEGSVTAMLSSVTELAPLFVIGKVMIAVPLEARQLPPRDEVIEPKTTLLLGLCTGARDANPEVLVCFTFAPLFM